MEYVSLRLDSSVLKQIEKALKEFNYSTRTEFFREAVREKLKQLEKERKEKKAWNALFAARGALKDHALTDEEFYRKKNEYCEKLAEELRKKYNLKP